jgi:hypothetical protein
MNSDDIWHPEKLEKQVNFLNENKNIDAVFTYTCFRKENMDEISKFFQYQSHYHFFVKNRTSAEWLRMLFNGVNYFSHPSIMIKRECYDTLGLYDNRFRQIPDFLMWIKLCKKYQPHVLPEELVFFRCHGSNTSTPSKANMNRIFNEQYFVFKRFFENMEISLFKETFGDILINKNFLTPIEYECEKALLFIHHNRLFQIIGLEMLYNLLENESSRKVLKENYQIDDNTFMKLNALSSNFLHARSWKDFIVFYIRIPLRFIFNAYKIIFLKKHPLEQHVT